MSSEAAAATAEVGDGGVKINEVWHVRHGERCDEVSGVERRAWEQSLRYKKGAWFDPFLTSYGHVQASRAGLYLKSLPFNQQLGCFDVVYTSPLVRAVQTAVCVSQGLGNLPLQVVPGLCSCTAALVRIGYTNAHNMLMTDAEITRAFAGVTVIPRDPLAPATFSGAAAWLATKACEKKGAEDDGDGCGRVSRVLAVGHREGTKAMAGRRVPTPHCCIGIFRTEASNNTHRYELYDLLSHKGKSLKPSGESSSYARPTVTTMGEDNGRKNDASNIYGGDRAVETLAARVMGLTVVSTEGSKPKGTDAAKRASSGGRASRTGSTGGTPRSISRGVAGLVRRIRGASSSLVSTTGKDHVPGATSSGASAEAGRRGKQTTNTALATRKPPRRTLSDGNGKRSDSAPGVPSRKGGGSCRTEPQPPPRAREGGSRRGAASAAPKKPGAVTSGTAASGGVENPRLVASPGGTCAGGGFRVGRRSSRRGSVGGGSTFAGFLGVPADTLCGESGVLSFLSAPELCTAQATCTPIATAATDESLWRELYSRLPRHLRDRSESGLPGTETTTPLHPKTLFVRAVSTASSAHAAKMAQKVAVVRRRLAAIHNLRGSVRSMKADLRVRVNGEPVGVVQTTGAKAQAWVSRSNLLSEPSVNGNDGARAFSLSSSLKVEVPASLETVELLRSMCVSLSWPDKDAALLPHMPVFRIDSKPVLSQARLLGTSAEGAVALYGVAEGSSRSTDGGSNRPCTRISGDGDGDRTPSRPLPVLRGCALLGVLPSRRQGEEEDADAGGVAFLTVHLPHDLVLHVATHRSGTGDNNPETVASGSRRSRSYGDDSAGPRYGLDNFAAALGLRTAGVPLWETASRGVGGCIRSRPRDVVSRRTQPVGDAITGVAVVCFDLLRPGAGGDGGGVDMTSEERTLSAGPGLPFSTPSGFSGVVADVSLADFTLCGEDGMPLWSFTSPMVFEACLDAGAAEGDCGSAIDMAHREVTEERRRGVVVEQGVGRVVVELGLVESRGEDGGQDGRARSAASQRGCPVGHVWMIVSARAELELDVINAWFGTNHVSPC